MSCVLSSNQIVSVFGCSSNLFLCFLANFLISTATVGSSIFWWILSFLSYQQAVTISLKAIVGRCCIGIIKILDLLEQPYSWMPYVHICLIIAVYKCRLFSMDGLESHPTSQQILQIFSFICCFFTGRRGASSLILNLNAQPSIYEQNMIKMQPENHTSIVGNKYRV